MSILTIANYALSTLECAFFTFTTVNYEKRRIFNNHEEMIFFFIFLFACVLYTQGIQEMLCGEKWNLARGILREMAKYN